VTLRNLVPVLATIIAFLAGMLFPPYAVLFFMGLGIKLPVFREFYNDFGFKLAFGLLFALIYLLGFFLFQDRRQAKNNNDNGK
jgi:hypothetical protein